MAHAGGAQSRVACLARRYPWAVDLLAGAFFAGGYLVSIHFGDDFGPHPGRAWTGWDFVAAAGTFALFAARRHWPRTVLALAVAASALSMARGEAWAAALPAAVAAAYTVATRSTRQQAWRSGGSAAVLLYTASAIWPGPQWPGASWWLRGNFGILAAVGMSVAIGDAIRTRRAYVAAVEERARRAEESRDAEARRRVVEERLRIARELHDVVAHRLALISVQAGVATHLMRSRPEQAAAALGHVRQAANTAVEELGTVLGVLRQDGDAEPATRPAAGLAHLSGLLDSVAATGLRVRSRQSGPPRGLPAAADLAAYRIIQESLTNARKHGAGGTADLHVTYAADGVTIDVTNPVQAPGRPAGGTRLGLIGMRERVAAVGGTLSAGPDAPGTFTVHAFVPAPESSGVIE